MTRAHSLESPVEACVAPKLLWNARLKPSTRYYSRYWPEFKHNVDRICAMASGQDFTEHKIEGETVYDAGFMRMERDRVRLHDGTEAERHVVRHCGAAAVLPQFEDGSVLLVRQFRYALGAHTLEIPAGKIDGSDEPLATAQRELLEETGYAAEHWKGIGHFHSSTGFTDELLTVFHASGLRMAGAPRPEEGEHVESVRLPLEDVWQLKLNGEITEARTQYALLWLRCSSCGLI